MLLAFSCNYTVVQHSRKEVPVIFIGQLLWGLDLSIMLVLGGGEVKVPKKVQWVAGYRSKQRVVS